MATQLKETNRFSKSSKYQYNIETWPNYEYIVKCEFAIKLINELLFLTNFDIPMIGPIFLSS